MKSRILWIILSFLMALSLVLASCITTTEEEEEEEEEGVAVEEEEEEEEEGPPVTGDWWDKLGEPQYGGTITIRMTSIPSNFNPYMWMGLAGYWYEPLFENSWTEEDRSAFTTLFVSEEYWQGVLAESWEWQDAQTLIIKIREGVHWQDKPPVNGREFTAYDAQHHFDWLLGTGSGYTEKNAVYRQFITSWEKATALDKYTLEFKFLQPTLVLNYWSILERMGGRMEAPESVQQGLFDDWKNAVGTGPWMLMDYVAASSITLGKNPDYWGYDERHPENQLPYVDKVKLQCIPDISTALAALRTGKIDMITKISWEQADSLARTNPELQQVGLPWMSNALDMRCDREPFTDINVRKALQMAIDRETIAETHYGGYVDGKPAGIVAPALKGFAFPYDEWPEELKEEYSYNPEQARHLLADAGYPNGFKTNCVASSADDLDLAQIIRAYFLDIGVDMEIKVMEPAAWQAYVSTDQHDQMDLWTASATHMPPQIIISMRYSKNMNNFSRCNDPVYDEIFWEYLEVSDADEAKQLLREADRRAISQHFAVNVCPTAHFNALQPYLKGYSGECADFIGGNPFYWARLWIDQDLKESMGR